MRACKLCPDPAQWAELLVTRFPHTEEEKKRKIHPRGPKFEAAGFYCTVHKNIAETQPSEQERVFRFVGAVPDGSYHPQS